MRPRGLAKTGGRRKGSANKITAELVKAVEDSGLTPLDFMLKIMRNEAAPEGAEPAQIIAFTAMRFEAAKAAAPYVHARLAAIEHTGKDGSKLVDEFDINPMEAARRISFILRRGMNQLENETIEGLNKLEFAGVTSST